MKYKKKTLFQEEEGISDTSTRLITRLGTQMLALHYVKSPFWIQEFHLQTENKMDIVKENCEIQEQRSRQSIRLLTCIRRPARGHIRDLNKYYLVKMSNSVMLSSWSCQLVAFKSHVAHRCGFYFTFWPTHYILNQIRV